MSFLDQMKQMMEMKQKMEEVKKRLDTIEVSAENEYVKVTVNGNRRVKDIEVKKTDDKLLLERYIAEAVNEACQNAETMLQSEFSEVTKGMLPNLPGM
jgi:DNA-binding YbaB/EbfC family protein